MRERERERVCGREREGGRERERERERVGCITSQEHASVSQGRMYSDNFTFCYIETSSFYLTKSQYTDIGPTSPSADPITHGAWQGNHWSVNFMSLV